MGRDRIHVVELPALEHESSLLTLPARACERNHINAMDSFFELPLGYGCQNISNKGNDHGQ